MPESGSSSPSPARSPSGAGGDDIYGGAIINTHSCGLTHEYDLLDTDSSHSKGVLYEKYKSFDYSTSD